MKRFNIKAERRALFVALENLNERARNYVLTNARTEDFGTDEGRAIRRRIEFLMNRGEEIPSVDEMLEDPALDKSARNFLRPKPGDLEQARNLKRSGIKSLVKTLQMHRKGRVILDGQQEVNTLMAGEVDEETLVKVRDKLLEMVSSASETSKKRINHIGKDAKLLDAQKTIRKHTNEKLAQGSIVSTGLPALDSHAGGFGRGDLVVMSAKRGGGKSTMAMQMAINQYKAGLNVGFISMEMGEDQLTERILSNITGVLHSQIRKKEGLTDGHKEDMARELHKFRQEGQKARSKNPALKGPALFTTWDVTKDPKYTPELIKLDLGPYNYDVIYIDYLTLFHSKGKELWIMQKEYSRFLKNLAADMNCVIVLLTQLGDDDRVKYGKGPEEDADWWLKWVYGDEERSSGETEIELNKARHVASCVIPAKFQMAQMKILTQGTVVLYKSTKEKGKEGESGKTMAVNHNSATDWTASTL